MVEPIFLKKNRLECFQIFRKNRFTFFPIFLIYSQKLKKRCLNELKIVFRHGHLPITLLLNFFCVIKSSTIFAKCWFQLRRCRTEVSDRQRSDGVFFCLFPFRLLHDVDRFNGCEIVGHWLSGLIVLVHLFFIRFGIMKCMRRLSIPLSDK